MKVTVRRTTTRRARLPAGPRQVEVGFPGEKVEGGIIERAIYNEFGTERIPERPFFRNAVRQNRTKYREGMKIAARKLLAGQETLRGALSKLGIMAQGDIQEEITNLRDPPNTESTIERKGSSNPLIDTGEMRQAVTWRIRE